jgi:hypothetical protein
MYLIKKEIFNRIGISIKVTDKCILSSCKLKLFQLKPLLMVCVLLKVSFFYTLNLIIY